MGTHINGPSKIKNCDNLTLKEYLNGQDLPFLFKVLSVRTALSIQAHPDRILAEKLHASDPKNYRDANHKPEMAIALGEFEALCGFRPVEIISSFARKYGAFSELIGGVEVIEKSIQKAFENLMKSYSGRIKEAIEKMPKGGGEEKEEDFDENVELRLFHRLNQQYPAAVGGFCVFFLNHFTLQSGEAVFLAANEPHAYLHGNCLECMATSDNVVRAGLTPKHRDVQTLCSMLTYKTFSGLKDLLTLPQKIPERPAARVYKSPVPEFSVLQVALKAKNEQDECKSSESFGRSILICARGTLKFETEEGISLDLALGSVVYLPEKCKYKLTNLNEGEGVIYQAFEPLLIQ